jgi:hypothetical protein
MRAVDHDASDPARFMHSGIEIVKTKFCVCFSNIFGLEIVDIYRQFAYSRADNMAARSGRI